MTKEAKNIIDRWGNKPIYQDEFIFPILHHGVTPEQEYMKLKQVVKTINKYMRRIGKAVEIEKDITTYTARHTFSTVLKRSNVSTEFISESLGHSNLKTTENYLDSFEDDTKKEFAKFLTKF